MRLDVIAVVKNHALGLQSLMADLAGKRDPLCPCRWEELVVLRVSLLHGYLRQVAVWLCREAR